MNCRLEKLTICLSIQTSLEQKELLGDKYFERWKKIGGLGDDEILERLMEVWPGITPESKFMGADGRKVNIGKIFTKIERSGNGIGPLTSNGVKIHVVNLISMELTLITIEETESGSIENWYNWVKKFSKENCFVQAWVVDLGYDYWQNATDILEYESADKDYSKLPLVSNNLPFPLQQQVIDVSENPGRVVMHTGYVEAVSPKMWLGKSFIDRFDITKEKLDKTLQKFSISKDENSCVEIVYCDDIVNFYNSDLDQRNIRHILYDVR